MSYDAEHHPNRRHDDTLGGWIAAHWKTVVASVVIAVVIGLGLGRVDSNSSRLEKAVCALRDYAADQASVLELAHSPAAPRLRKLANDMQATGIHCIASRPAH